jgi:polyisoprenoid-binding protein YceI
MRAGFTAVASINRHDFGISWDGELGQGGSVVGSTVQITIDAEAIRED